MKKLPILLFCLGALLFNTTKTEAALPISQQTTSTKVEKSISTETSTDAVENIDKKESQVKAKTKRKVSWFKKLMKRGGDSQVVGALLAFFLGNFGAHRFYYGDKGKGFLMLGITLAGIALIIIGIATLAASATISVPVLALIGYAMLLFTGIWAFVDFIRILIGSYPS